MLVTAVLLLLTVWSSRGSDAAPAQGAPAITTTHALAGRLWGCCGDARPGRTWTDSCPDGAGVAWSRGPSSGWPSWLRDSTCSRMPGWDPCRYPWPGRTSSSGPGGVRLGHRRGLDHGPESAPL